VLRQRLVPALLLVAHATASLAASSTIAQAAEECRAKPSPATPAGSRWLYRVNRADHRRCWFLSSRDVGLHSRQRRTALTSHRHFAGDITGAVQQGQQGDGEPQIASAQTDDTDIALPTEQTRLPQIAAPLDAPSSQYLIPRSVPTITYRGPSPIAQSASGPAVSAARSANQTSLGAGHSNIVLLAGAAAAGLLFAGGVFHFTRHVHRRSRKQAVTDGRGVRQPVVIKSSLAAKLQPTTTDPADDLKRSLGELKHDLQRASEACNLPSSYQTHASSCATLLPHAAAWLSRPQAKPTRKPANSHAAAAEPVRRQALPSRRALKNALVAG
jgi:hypothetical protein